MTSTQQRERPRTLRQGWRKQPRGRPRPRGCFRSLDRRPPERPGGPLSRLPLVTAGRRQPRGCFRQPWRSVRGRSRCCALVTAALHAADQQCACCASLLISCMSCDERTAARAAADAAPRLAEAATRLATAGRDQGQTRQRTAGSVPAVRCRAEDRLTRTLFATLSPSPLECPLLWS